MPSIVQEVATFDKAVADFTALPNSREPIRAMMGLALEGQHLRGWASAWLQEKCAITVAPDEEPGHAAPSTAGSLLQ